MGVFEEGTAAGVHFYSDPERLTPEMVDPLLWPIVQRINRSGWCWTAESCQGHPDATEWEPWAGNTRPMLRLVCRWADRGRLLTALHDAALYVEDYGFSGAAGDARAWGLELWPHPKIRRESGHAARPVAIAREWCEVLVYLNRVATVYDRTRALGAYERLAELVAP